ncbi:MAG: MmcQ/YjbR family DNA-binding protein [Slackia sp.]
MDKRNWISIDLDADVVSGLLMELCDHSYELVFSKLTKKLQREIVETARKAASGF